MVSNGCHCMCSFYKAILLQAQEHHRLKIWWKKTWQVWISACWLWKIMISNSLSQASGLQSATSWTSPEHGRPPHAASMLGCLVLPLLPPPHVAEHPPHSSHSLRTQGCGGGGGVVVGAGSGSAHCSLICRKSYKFPDNKWELKCYYYLGQNWQGEYKQCSRHGFSSKSHWHTFESVHLSFKAFWHVWHLHNLRGWQ